MFNFINTEFYVIRNAKIWFLSLGVYVGAPFLVSVFLGMYAGAPSFPVSVPESGIML